MALNYKYLFQSEGGVTDDQALSSLTKLNWAAQRWPERATPKIHAALSANPQCQAHSTLLGACPVARLGLHQSKELSVHGNRVNKVCEVVNKQLLGGTLRSCALAVVSGVVGNRPLRPVGQY